MFFWIMNVDFECLVLVICDWCEMWVECCVQFGDDCR